MQSTKDESRIFKMIDDKQMQRRLKNRISAKRSRYEVKCRLDKYDFVAKELEKANEIINQLKHKVDILTKQIDYQHVFGECNPIVDDEVFKIRRV